MSNRKAPMWEEDVRRPKKLIIQIPCYNEEEALAVTLASLPRSVDGVDVVEWLVIDDGSTDGTAEVARAAGVDHVVRLPRNRGLANAFLVGLEAALAADADVIVNTDADNQYRAEDIPALIAPVLRGEAEIVVGARPIATIPHFSRIKKVLQRLGSWAVRVASNTSVPDAPSGFRAFSREAALRLHVFTDYTYTLETIIQAGQKGMAIASVPVGTNPELRPSRLVESISAYVRRSILTIIRIFATYRPFAFFSVPGALSFIAGFLISARFLYFYVTGDGAGHIQSLILSALLMGAGFFLLVMGLVADLISVNRKLLERVDWRMRRLEERMRREDRIQSEEREEPASTPPGV